MDARISQLTARTTLQNNDVLPVVASGASVTNKVTLQAISDFIQNNLTNAVTSVGITMPTGFVVTNSPITSSGIIGITFASGYSIPTDTNQNNWTFAYTYISNIRTDYNDDIIGAKDGVNNIFTTSNNYRTGTTKVYRNGLRMTKGATYDYIESSANTITFAQAPDNGDILLIDYIIN
jgi:hypothetical protein